MRGWLTHQCAVHLRRWGHTLSCMVRRSEPWDAESGGSGAAGVVGHSRSRGRSVVRLTVANVLEALASPLLPSQLEETVRRDTPRSRLLHIDGDLS